MSRFGPHARVQTKCDAFLTDWADTCASRGAPARKTKHEGKGLLALLPAASVHWQRCRCLFGCFFGSHSDQVGHEMLESSNPTMAAQSVGEGIEKFALHVAVWDDDADRLQDLLVAGRHGEMRSSDR